MLPATKTFEITFAIQVEAESPSERITHVGGVRSDGSRWLIEQQVAIRAIESNTWQFYVTRDHERVDVAVTRSRNNVKFLTAAGGDNSNLLLALPEDPPPPHCGSLSNRGLQTDPAA